MAMKFGVLVCGILAVHVLRELLSLCFPKTCSKKNVPQYVILVKFEDQLLLQLYFFLVLLCKFLYMVDTQVEQVTKHMPLHSISNFNPPGD
jgi:hypothetical protein